MPAPHVIQKWPGEDSAVNKVPTLLLYEMQNGDQESFRAWGFQCREAELEDESLPGELVRRRCFKTYLPGSEEYSSEQVKGWFRDYLRQLRFHIKIRVEEHLGLGVDMGSLRINFVFSVPTTWTAQSVVNDFRNVIAEAGFDRGGENHTVSIGLTEAQAAAVFATKYSLKKFQAGDVLLICDAGGGTTDLCLLEMRLDDKNMPIFEELAPTDGEDVGSTNIDDSFAAFIERRIASDPSLNALIEDIDKVAEDMASSQAFQKIKGLFGTPESRMTSRINCPGIPREYCNPAISIENGKMLITRQAYRRWNI